MKCGEISSPSISIRRQIKVKPKEKLMEGMNNSLLSCLLIINHIMNIKKNDLILGKPDVSDSELYVTALSVVIDLAIGCGCVL